MISVRCVCALCVLDWRLNRVCLGRSVPRRGCKTKITLAALGVRGRGPVCTQSEVPLSRCSACLAERGGRSSRVESSLFCAYFAQSKVSRLTCPVRRYNTTHRASILTSIQSSIFKKTHTFISLYLIKQPRLTTQSHKQNIDRPTNRIIPIKSLIQTSQHTRPETRLLTPLHFTINNDLLITPVWPRMDAQGSSKVRPQCSNQQSLSSSTLRSGSAPAAHSGTACRQAQPESGIDGRTSTCAHSVHCTLTGSVLLRRRSSRGSRSIFIGADPCSWCWYSWGYV